MENLATVQRYLGGKKALGTPRNDLDLIAIIRKGLPVSVLASLCEHLKMSEELVVASLGIARRTAARRKRQGGRLKPVESELLYRLARALASATDVLGNEENARKWLLTENRALGGLEPITLLDTGIGFQDVMDVLGRIEHGVYS